MSKQPEQQFTPDNQSVIQAFDSMVNQMRGELNTLEGRVGRRSRDLETVAEVSKQVSSILDLEQLLPEFCGLTKQQFQLYHAHVYLLDDKGKMLKLVAGAGEAGRIMVREGHTIPFQRQNSLVARAAREQDAVVVNDISKTVDFLPNPLLPNTKAEMAIPMIVGETLIGVLDVQAQETDRFGAEDVQIYTTLASQVAVAIQNARAFAEMQQARQETERIFNTSVALIGSANFDGYFVTLNAAWSELLGYTLDELMAEPYVNFVHPDDHENTSDQAESNESGGGTLAFENRYLAKDGTYKWLSWNATPDLDSGLIHFVSRDITAQKQQELELQARLRDLQLNNAIIETAREEGSLESVIEKMMTLILDSLDGDNSVLSYYDTTTNQWQGFAGAGTGMTSEIAKTFNDPGEAYPHGMAAIKSTDVVAIDDTTEYPDFPQEYIDLLGLKSVATLPITEGDHAIGVLFINFNSNQHNFTDDEISLMRTVAQQISVTVARKRAEAELALAQNESELLFAVSSAINKAQNPDDLATAVGKQNLPSQFSSITLTVYDTEDLDTATNSIVLSDWRRDGTSFKGLSIPLDSFQTSRLVNPTEMSVFNNIPTNPDMSDTERDAYTQFGIISILNVPLVSGSRVFGSFTISTEDAYAFNPFDIRVAQTITEQLSVVLERMSLTEQTQKRAKELETVSQIGTQITSSLDLDDVLHTVANLTATNFNRYYAQVYLLDPQSNSLILRAGSGDVGQQLVEGQHNIPLSHEASLVAQAARTRQPVVVNNVRADSAFMANPLLPDTQAELAVPILLGDEVIGVLDVQDDKVGQFTKMEVEAKRVLANQIATAVQNAREFQNTQKALREVDKRAAEMQTVAQVSAEASRSLDTEYLLYTVSDLSKEQFNLYHAHIYLVDADGKNLVLTAGAGDVGRQMVQDGHSIPLNRKESLVASAARSQQAVIVNDVTKNPNHLPNPRLPDTVSEMAIPIISTNNETLGVLDVQANITNRFQDEDAQVMNTLAGQVAVAIQNARSFQYAQDTLRQTAELYHGSELINRANTIDEVLEGIITSLDIDQIERANVMLYDVPWRDVEPDHATVTAVWEYDGRPARAPVGTKYPVANFPIVQMVKPGHPVIVRDSDDEHLADKNLQALLQVLGMRSVIFYPLVTGGDYIGLLTIQSSRPMPLSEAKIRQVATLSDQGATVISGYRLLEQMQKRATEMETVTKVSAATTTILDMQELITTVSNLTRDSFNLYHAHIYLLNEDHDTLILAGGAGDAGTLMRDNHHAIPMANTNSVVVQCALTGKGVVVNDVSANPNFLPNPLLPETRSEMAIPMIVGGNLIGVLDTQAKTINHFTDEDVQIKSVLADQIAVAVQNARSYAEAQYQAERERETAERLREVDRLKSQFLANMSHELRTPLNSIIGYSEVLLDGVDGELNEDAEEDVEAIHNSGKHLLSIINEILDLAKIEAGEMQLSKKDVDLTEFAGEIVRNAQILVKGKPVMVELIEEAHVPLIYADPIRLRQILWNLVSNAVKFTEHGSVKVSLAMQSDDMVSITVSDTGVGMTEEGLSVIFERFSQVDGSSTRRAGGTGLGLTITRQLIEMHGGEISVSSEFGAGSIFTFTMPVKVDELELQKA